MFQIHDTNRFFKQDNFEEIFVTFFMIFFLLYSSNIHTKILTFKNNTKNNLNARVTGKEFTDPTSAHT